jgi:hypothetical protein
MVSMFSRCVSALARRYFALGLHGWRRCFLNLNPCPPAIVVDHHFNHVGEGSVLVVSGRAQALFEFHRQRVFSCFQTSLALSISEPVCATRLCISQYLVCGMG